MKKLKMLFTLTCVLLITGCTDSFKTKQLNECTLEEYDYANSQLELANAEYLSLLKKDCISRSASEEESLAMQTEIESAAWMYYYTNDDKPLIEVTKKYGIYDELKDIAKKYEVEENEEKRSLYGSNNSRAISSNFFYDSNNNDADDLHEGDILLCTGYASSTGGSSNNSIAAVIIPGEWKHAGLYTVKNVPDGYCCFSASDKAEILTEDVKDNSSNVGCVGYEKKSYWLGRQKVKLMRVKDSTEEQGMNALAYAKKYEGYPFGFGTNRKKTDMWYCSKLVFKAWETQNYNLENDSGIFEGIYVTPTDIEKDNNTKEIRSAKY